VLETIGYDAAVAASFAPWEAADATAGRVLRVDRGVCTLLTEDGPRRATLGGGLLSRIAADHAEAPCPGDWGVVRRWPDGPLTLERVLPRHSAVPREGAPQGEAPAAANVDAVALVVHTDAPPASRVMRVVVSTSSTIGGGSTDEGEELVVDLDTRAGVDDLLARLDGRLTLAVGCTASPAGRGHDCRAADLVDALVGTRPLGARHPGLELVVLPTGGAVVDLTAAPMPTEETDHAARPVP
jgi:ribosome biogenesis GTPase